jgi:hypothetical protein
LRLLGAGPGWMLPRPALVNGVMGGFLMLLPLHVAWEMLFRFSGYRRITMAAIRRDEMTPEAYRTALERRRDRARRSWLWYVAFLVPASALSALGHTPWLWSTTVEAVVTLVAVLLLRALFTRMADLLQQEIDGLRESETAQPRP